MSKARKEDLLLGVQLAVFWLKKKNSGATKDNMK